MNLRFSATQAILLALSLGFASASLADTIPASWQSRGPGGGGALFAPSISPFDAAEYYFACDMSEQYHTKDFGASYSIVPFSQVQAGRYSIVQFTNVPGTIYTVSYAGDIPAPVKSTDGGVTWAALPGNPLADDGVYGIWADPNDSTRLIVAGYSSLYLSKNGGTTFSQINVTINQDDGVLVGGAFFDGQKIYLGTSIGLIVSTNNGGTFTNAGTPGIAAGQFIRSFAGAKSGVATRFFCLTVSTAYPGQLTEADYYQDFQGIYSLDNGTGSWASESTGIDPATDFLMSIAMATNDINTVYAGGGSDSGDPVVMKTSNAGGSWSHVLKTASNQNINTGWSGAGGDRGWSYGEVVLGLAVAPLDSSKALFTDLGFIHKTSDGGASWQQAYVSTADQHALGATTISQGSYHSIGLEDTSCWQMLWIDAQNIFAGYSDIKGTRSVDGGVTWGFKYSGHDANTMYRAVLHPTTGVIYAGTSNIHDMYQSTRLADAQLNATDARGRVISSADKGATWSTLHTFSHPVFWVALDPGNSTRMYASVIHSTAGGIFVSDNINLGGSSTWTKLSAPPRTQGHPASIIVLNNGKVLCTYSGRRTTSAFTDSSGLFLYDPSTTSWSDVSAPGMHYWTKDVVLDPADATQNTWYVCVFSGWGGPPNGLGGLYKTSDAGAHWTRINSLDRVTSISFNPAHSDEAYLTTETEGLWHTNNSHATTPTFALVTNYSFRQPERVFFDPYHAGTVWITSFGNGLMKSYVDLAENFHLQPQKVSGQPTQAALVFGPIITGRTYSVQSTPTLQPAAWAPLTSSTQSDTGGQRTVTDLQATTAQKFYRVQISEP